MSVKLLARYGHILATSKVWETAPVGYSDQPNFLNAVVLIESDMSAREFQEQAIPQVEAALGRVRGKNKFGPRSIDIDILLFNSEILTLSHRQIPSPEILERPFVALPIAEIAPDLLHPETRETLAQIANRMKTSSEEMILREDIVLWVDPKISD